MTKIKKPNMTWTPESNEDPSAPHGLLPDYDFTYNQQLAVTAALYKNYNENRDNWLHKQMREIFEPLHLEIHQLRFKVSQLELAATTRPSDESHPFYPGYTTKEMEEIIRCLALEEKKRTKADLNTARRELHSSIKERTTKAMQHIIRNRQIRNAAKNPVGCLTEDMKETLE